MNTMEIIDATLASHPEGRSILTKIKVKTADTTYHDCEYLRRIVSVKFDINKLDSEGYTLQEVLDQAQGIIYEEAHKFVLAKIQAYIREQNPATPPEPQQNN
jgi:hypothetical protein